MEFALFRSWLEVGVFIFVEYEGPGSVRGGGGGGSECVGTGVDAAGATSRSLGFPLLSFDAGGADAGTLFGTG